jgi:photosystem II stability/assembly factor-like uncharacterized protein
MLASAVVAARPLDWDVVQMKPAVSGSDLCFLADGQHGWMVGSGGAGGEVIARVYATADGGETWSALPFPDSASVAIEGVFFADSMAGWVVGPSGYIRKTTDAGLTWLAQSSPVSRKLHRVHFTNPATGWITGGSQDGSSFLLLKTADGGATWQDLSFGSNCYSCEDIWFADSLHGWIVGQDASINPFIQHTTDGGAIWTAQSPNLPTGNGPVSSVCFPTSLIGWATSSSIYQTPSGSILHTTNGGDSWYVQANSGLHYNYALDAPDTLHAAILSTQVLSPAAGKVFCTTDGGASWASAALPTYSYGSGCQYRGADIWVCQDNSQILRSSDHGATWDWQLYSPLFRSVEWSSPDIGWVVAGSSTGPGYCLKTTDAGLTWPRDANAPGGAQVQFLDPNRGWMLQEGNSAKVNRTTDGGANWAQFGLGTANWVGRMRFASADSGWACGSQGTMRFSSNGGASWSAQNINTTSYCEDVFLLDSKEGWAAGGYGGGSGFIRHTTDGGQNWETQTPAQADHFNRSFFLDNQRGWIGAYGGLVHGTTDGGITWQILGSVPHFYFEDILFIDSLTGWAAAGNAASNQPDEDGRGFVYKSTNGGITWTQEYGASLPRGFVQDLKMQPGGTLWACGSHAGLLKSAGAQWVEEQLPPEPSRPMLTVTPNPFRERCLIRLAKAPAPGARLAIRDVSGRLVSSFSSLLTSHSSLAWDGRDDLGQPVRAGVYFCALEGTTAPVRVKLIRS